MSRREPPPLRHIRLMEKHYGADVWKIMDTARLGLPASGNDALCPMSPRVWARVLEKQRDMEQFRAARDGCILSALYTWRRAPIVWLYDTDAAQCIAETEMKGPIPIGNLYRLPAPCVYVGLMGAFDIRGFYAMLDIVGGDVPDALLVVFDFYPALAPVNVFDGLGPLALHLPSNRQSVNVKGLISAQKHIRHDLDVAGQLTHMVFNLLMFLACGPDDCEERPARKVAKGRARRSDAPVPVWDVGTRLGSALRTAWAVYQDGRADRDMTRALAPRQRPRPHIRRAHWHTYWRGPRDGARESYLRWIPPTGINVHAGPIATALRPVGAE